MNIKIIFIFLILVTIGFTQVRPGDEYKDPLITGGKIIQARKKLIKKLLMNNRYREAIDELLELKNEVPRKSAIFINLWIGVSYMNIADYIERGIMRENDYGELEYREEIDIKYYTEKDKVIIKDLLRSRKDLFTDDELKKMDSFDTIASFDYMDNDLKKVLSDAEIIKADQEIAESGLTGGDVYIPWNEQANADSQNSEFVVTTNTTTSTTLNGTLSAPMEESFTNTSIKIVTNLVKVIYINKTAMKYYELAIRYFNKVISLSINNPYRERAVIKKAETFYHMQEKNLCIAEYNYFLKTFSKSKQIVDVMIAKGNVYADLKAFRAALKIFEEILDAYPETGKKNYIILKIKYLRMMLGIGSEKGAANRDQVYRKLKVLEEFEAEIKRKEERLKELEDLVK